jgi:hypothetical protein
LGRLPQLGILLLQAAHLFLYVTILFFKVYQENMVLKSGVYGVDDPMKGTLPRRQRSQADFMERISFIAAADLKDDENDGAENQGNDNERATASPEVCHLNT